MVYIKMQYISHYQYYISSTQNKKRKVNTENIEQDNSLQPLINDLNTSNKKKKWLIIIQLVVLIVIIKNLTDINNLYIQPLYI